MTRHAAPNLKRTFVNFSHTVQKLYAKKSYFSYFLTTRWHCTITVKVASGHGCHNTASLVRIIFWGTSAEFVCELFKNGLTNQLEFHNFLLALSEDDLDKFVKSNSLGEEK